MTNKARKTILQNIQRALQRTELSELAQNTLRDTVFSVKKSDQPAQNNIEIQFTEKANVAATMVIEGTLSSVTHIILDILKSENYPAVIRSASDVPISWQHYPEFRVNVGAAITSDQVTVTGCLCGVAETGTLVLLSGPANPTTLSFLSSLHIVILRKENIVAWYEDAIEMIRERQLDPRLIHFITGPSRTGDIEQTVQIGMHGPKKLYVILV